MKTKFEVIKATMVKELGSAVTETGSGSSKTTYSYIELHDGHLLKQVEIGHALDGKLAMAHAKNESVDLHIASSSLAKELGIMAIRTSDSRLFAQNVPEFHLAFRLLVPFLYVSGVILLPFFGMGLPLLWIARKVQKLIAVAGELRRYVRSLPDPILLGSESWL